MKYIFTSVVGLLLLFLSVPVFAQSKYEIYVSDIKVEKPEYSVGEEIEGKFTLFNVEDTGQSDIYYTISAGEYSPEYMRLISVRGTTEKKGPLYLQGDVKQEIPFIYKLPDSLSGVGALEITAYLKDGTTVAQGNLPITVSGETSIEAVSLVGSSLLINVERDFLVDFELLEVIEVIEEGIIVPSDIGVMVYDGDVIDFSYVLTPTKVSHDLTPTLRLYNRSNVEGVIIKEVVYDSVATSTNNETKTYSIELPINLDAGVYHGVLELKGEGAQVELINLRYIIAGPIATIRNITTDTLEINKGRDFDVLVTYGAQPIDEVRPELQFENNVFSIEVIVYNELGEEVSQATTLIEPVSDSGEVTMAFKDAKVDAKSLSFVAYAIDAEGNVLDEYITVLPNIESLEDQESIGTESRNLSDYVLPAIVFVVIVLAGLLLFILIKKKVTITKAPIVIVGIGVLLATVILFAAGKGDSVEAFTSINIGPGHFSAQLNSVLSPSPPVVRSYDPGESFLLQPVVTYGACNNKPLYKSIFSPSQDDWWAMTPPGENETAAQRLEYWTENGVDIVNDMPGAADDFLVSDLQTQIGISPQEEIDAKRIGELFGYIDVEAASKVDVWNRSSQIVSMRVNGGFSIGGSWLLAIAPAVDDSYLGTGIGNVTQKSKGEIGPNFQSTIDDAESRVAEFEEVRSIVGKYETLSPELLAFDFSNTDNFSRQVGTTRIQIWPIVYNYNIFTPSPELAEYHKMLTELSVGAANFVDPIAGRFTASLSGHWYTMTTKPSKVYQAPTEPGLYDIPFYVRQSNNMGTSEIIASQEICVRGAGVCPNEVVVPPVCPNLPGAYVKHDGEIYEKTGNFSSENPPGFPGFERTNYQQDEDGDCSPTSCPDGTPPPANLGATCGCAQTGVLGTIQCDGSCQNPDGVTIPAECAFTNCPDGTPTPANGTCPEVSCTPTLPTEPCTPVQRCGESVERSYSCTPSGWKCTAVEQRTCPQVDVCSEPGIQVVPPLGTQRNEDGTCTAPEQTPVVINQCSITNTAPSSYCVQLFDKDGNPTYGQSDISQTDYDLYYKNNVEVIYPIDTETGKPTTDHTIWGTASSNAGGQCIANVCPVGQLEKSGCFIPSVGATAQCYAQDISVQTPLQTTLTTSPDRIFDGGQCIVTWTSQGAASCTLKTTGGEQLSTLLGAQAVLNVEDSSVGVVLTCTAPNNQTTTKSATCRVFGNFSER